MRQVRTRVLPVPAPASTRTGPSRVSTASRCSGLRPVEIRWRRGRPGTRGDAARERLVVGEGVLGQLVRLGHWQFVFPTGREGEPS